MSGFTAPPEQNIVPSNGFGPFASGGGGAPTTRLVADLNGISQYMEFDSQAPITITLDTISTANGNAGLPAGSPSLADGVRQTIQINNAGAPVTEFFRNTGVYYQGQVFSLTLDGVVYGFSDGFDNNPVIANNAATLGPELYDFANVGTLESVVITQELTGFSVVSNNDNLDRSYINFTTEIGKTYRIFMTRDYVTGSPNLTVFLRQGSNGAGAIVGLSSAVGIGFVFTATATDYTLLLDTEAAPAPVTYAVSDVSIKEAEGYGTAINFTEATWVVVPS